MRMWILAISYCDTEYRIQNYYYYAALFTSKNSQVNLHYFNRTVSPVLIWYEMWISLVSIGYQTDVWNIIIPINLWFRIDDNETLYIYKEICLNSHSRRKECVVLSWWCLAILDYTNTFNVIFLQTIEIETFMMLHKYSQIEYLIWLF